MEELKPRRTYSPCDECPYGIDMRDGSGSDAMCKICEFKTLLDRRAAPENKPLTLEQLRQMDEEPVWVGEKDKRSRIGHYGLVDTVRERVIFNRSTYTTFKAVAGKTAYARRPLEAGEKG